MNKGILRISFNDAKKLIIQEKPELKDANIFMTFADVDNKMGEVEFYFTTDKPVDNVAYEISDYSVDVRRIGLSHTKIEWHK